MIEVIDEVLAGTPKYRIRDNSGNIIVDNVTIEMITEIIQSGTKLNKVLFDSIQTDFDSITVGKYFTPIHSFVDDNVLNTFSPSYIPVMTANTQGSFKATGTTSSTNYYYLFATDKGITITQDKYIQIELDAPIIPKEMTMQNTYGRHYKILSSLDGVNFDVLIEDVDVPYDYETKVMDLSSNTKWCKFIRIQNIENLNNSSSARNFRITKAIKNQVVKNNLFIPITFNRAEKQRIMVETPAEQDASQPTQITFENVALDTTITLKPNEKYELIYIDNKLQVYKELNDYLIKELSIKAGTISHGGTIPKTAGFNYYIYFVSPYSAGADSAEDNSYEADGSGWSITCQVNQSTRVVTSQAVSKTRRDTSNSYTGITTKSATVNYLELAWR